MAFSLQSIITSSRDRHASFHKARIPDAVVARWLSDYVNSLIAKCVTRDARYLQQSASVVLALSSANTASGAGADTGGGLPADLEMDGDVQLTTSTTGALVQVGASSDDGATIVVAERVVTSATASTITSTGAGRTVNEDAGRVVSITLGTGEGQFRQVASNTSDTWTLEDDWTTTPDSTSLMVVLDPTFFASGELGVATVIPSVDRQTGYLVKTDATGQPYIDYTTPLVADIDHGVTLPSVQALTGGTIRYADGDPEPLLIVDYRDRMQATRAVYRTGETVFLTGVDTDWEDVASVELHYVPLAPALTALADVLLLPDAAKGCVVAQVAGFMAMRVSGMADVNIDAGVYLSLGERSEREYLASVTLNGRHRTLRMRGMDG